MHAHEVHAQWGYAYEVYAHETRAHEMIADEPEMKSVIKDIVKEIGSGSEVDPRIYPG